MTSKGSSATISGSTEASYRKRTHNTARAKRREVQKTAPVRFVAVDGEGVTDEQGNHRYVLLSVGDQQVENPNGLSWQETCQFLYSQFQEGGIAFTGFFLGYDFTQWLRNLPENRAYYLLASEGKAKRARTKVPNLPPFPVAYDGWEFDILGTKRFKLRPVGSKRWMYICDTGPFFQKAFMKVIDPKEWENPVVTQEEYETLARGKSLRATATLDSSMREYNKLENEVLPRVLERLDAGFRELGIHLSPKQWFGPGQAAQQWLSNHECITSIELSSIVPRSYLDAARSSYFGGWFEIFAHGLIPGASYEYDINSAYPYIISTLPCLRHGLFSAGQQGDPPAGDALSLVYASIESRTKTSYAENRNIPHVGTMLHRLEDGSVLRPINTEGWFWHDELQAAMRAGLFRKNQLHIREYLRYDPCDCPPPFREVADIYSLRQRVGKKTPLGIACKLVPNSLYGKFAQSVGNPKFGNPIYASRITSRCRSMILDAIATHPHKQNDLLMVATDGVYFRTPHPTLTCTTQLGDWDTAEKHNLLLFKPGVYWDDKAREKIQNREDPEFRARGVSARDFASSISGIDQRFRDLSKTRKVPHNKYSFEYLMGGHKNISWPYARFPLSFSLVTATQALARGKWETAGTLIPDMEVTQSSDPEIKRDKVYWDGDILRSKPRYMDNPISVPYNKRFGMEDPFSDDAKEQWGESPDGLPGMQIRGMLNQ